MPVLRGLSLRVAAGSTAALVGPSGCGKSSVLALIMRLYDAASGVVLIDGVDARAVPPAALRDAVGWVAQEPPLFNESIGYNIAYGRAGGIAHKPQPGGSGSTAGGAAPPADVVRAAEEAHATGFVAGFEKGFATPVGVGGSALSGGQKQRVALARALIRAPRILLLVSGHFSIYSLTLSNTPLSLVFFLSRMKLLLLSIMLLRGKSRHRLTLPSLRVTLDGLLQLLWHTA